MKGLFPEMDAEIASDKRAAKRETVQRSREFLQRNRGVRDWILLKLKSDGPQVDANIVVYAIEFAESLESKNDFQLQMAFSALSALVAMWHVGELKRKPFPNHPSNEKCFIYRIA